MLNGVTTLSPPQQRHLHTYPIILTSSFRRPARLYLSFQNSVKQGFRVPTTPHPAISYQSCSNGAPVRPRVKMAPFAWFYIWLWRWELSYLKTGNNYHSSSFRLGIRTCVLMIPLLRITWLFGLLSPLHKAFTYIFTILNSTQVCCKFPW